MLEVFNYSVASNSQIELDKDIIDASKKIVLQTHYKKQEEEQEKNDKKDEMINRFSEKMSMLDGKIENGLLKLEGIIKLLAKERAEFSESDL